MSVRDYESPIACVCGETLHGLHQGVEYPTCPDCGESFCSDPECLATHRALCGPDDPPIPEVPMGPQRHKAP